MPTHDDTSTMSARDRRIYRKLRELAGSDGYAFVILRGEGAELYAHGQPAEMILAARRLLESVCEHIPADSECSGCSTLRGLAEAGLIGTTPPSPSSTECH
ncbi:hypothetical protein [Brevundimonas sp.]|uniref:hypothetical protein n=1 Tax=Brevundimonas sp. TaxID=1871086 RepID=UPI002D338BC5|nr:hypothetical protein [Brevundimonas sp.]HYD26931.1 hypothetical protein [Brevundimonas sp.]